MLPAWSAAMGITVPRAAAATAPQFIAPEQGPAWLPMGHVTLTILDTITGQSQQLSGAVGTALRFERLTVTAKGCYARPPEMRADSAAWLDIADSREGQDMPASPNHAGWFLAKEPALSGGDIADFDVRLVSCTP